MAGLFLDTFRKIDVELKSYTYPGPISSCLGILEQKTGLTREQLIKCNVCIVLTYSSNISFV
jgi:hypothetical protein